MMAVSTVLAVGTQYRIRDHYSTEPIITSGERGPEMLVNGTHV
jgi:hypothetical protein